VASHLQHGSLHRARATSPKVYGAATPMCNSFSICVGVHRCRSYPQVFVGIVHESCNAGSSSLRVQTLHPTTTALPILKRDREALDTQLSVISALLQYKSFESFRLLQLGPRYFYADVASMVPMPCIDPIQLSDFTPLILKYLAAQIILLMGHHFQGRHTHQKYSTAMPAKKRLP